MDAAQLTRKLAFVLAGSLLFAGAASAATSVSPASITLSSLGGTQKTVVVTTDTDFKVVNNSGWFSVSPTSGTAAQSPVTLTVTLTDNCTTKPSGCSTSFTVTDTAGTTTLATVAVANSSTPGGGGTDTNNLSASSSAITLSAAPGGYSLAQLVTITTSSTTSVTLQATPSQPWLSTLVNYPQTIQAGTIAPSTTVQIQANAATLGVGTYQGSVLVTPQGSTTGVTINVTFTVGSGSGVTGSLIPSPTSLTFYYPTGAQQANFTVTSTSTTQFYVSATTQSGGAWLGVNAPSTTPISIGNTLTAYINASIAGFLTTGSYTGTVTLTNVNNFADTTTIPVTLLINGGGSGTGGTAGAGPTSLSFAYQIGKASPRCQSIYIPTSGIYSVQTSGSPAAFFYTSASASGINAPTELMVCPAVGALNAGSYSGTLTLTSTTGYSQQISVALTVYNLPVVNAIVNNISGDAYCVYQAGGAGCNVSTVGIEMSDQSATTFTATPSAAWLTLSTTTGTTPGTFTVQMNPAGLSNGMNTATVTINASGAANSSFTIPFAVYVTGGSGSTTGNLTLNVSSMSFSAASSQSQTLSVSAAAAGTAFTATLPSTNCGWLQISPSGSLYTTTNIVVSIQTPPASTSTCNITLTSGSTTQTVPVTYTVSGSSGGTGSIQSDKQTLTFTSQVGSNPATQTLSITGINNATGVSYQAAIDTSYPWLSVSPASGTTPGTLTVSINTANMTTGAYTGYVIIRANGGNMLSIPVNLTITPNNTISATPATLSFSYVGGNSNPSPQTIQVTGSTTGLTYSANVTNGSNWLSVSPASGTAPAALSVSVDASTLTPNTYTGTIVVAGSGTSSGSTTITVTLTVTAPLPTITSVSNSASAGTGRVSAGELISIFGAAMGPATAATPASGTTQFPTTLGNVTVTVGGYPAPLLYVSNSQINAIVPYEINKPFIANPAVVVKYLGQSSNGVNLPQVGAFPGIFTVGGGTGQAAALNQNLSQNLASNPANKGEVVVLYLTGEGQTNPAGTSGKVTPATTPFAKPVSGDVTATIDGQPANVEFFGEAPGIVSGVMQVNVRIPTTVGSGAVPVVVRVGDVATQIDTRGIGTVTIAVK